MAKLFRIFTWVVLVVVLLVGIDQFLLRAPLDAPGLTQVQTFYLDFRGRFLNLIGVDGVARRPAQSIEQVIEATQVPSAAKKRRTQRYLYADETGTLQFADGLDAVPAPFRSQAQPLEE